MFIRILPTTLLQIFCENLLYFQVIFKSMKIADNTFPGNSECEWVKMCLKSKVTLPTGIFQQIIAVLKLSAKVICKQLGIVPITLSL